MSSIPMVKGKVGNATMRVGCYGTTSAGYYEFYTDSFPYKKVKYVSYTGTARDLPKLRSADDEEGSGQVQQSLSINVEYDIPQNKSFHQLAVYGSNIYKGEFIFSN